MKVTMQIQSIAKIEAEAIAAVTRYSTVGDACPYPFDTTAGTVFKRAFQAERTRQEAAIETAAAAGIKADLHLFSPVPHNTSIAHIARVNAELQRTNPV